MNTQNSGSKVMQNIVVLVGTLFLLCHALYSIYTGSLSLKGGSDILFAARPVAFSLIAFIEIAVSIYVFWAFLIKKPVIRND